MTDVERFVWGRLRRRRFVGFKFRRQVPIGRYIVDSVCLSRRLVIELDGGQHNAPDHRSADERRDAWVRSCGFRVLRFWNHQVLEDWEAIEEHLWRALHDVA